MTGLVATVRQLLLYTLWADRICLKVLEDVEAEDLARDTGTSFGSLLGTLSHILGSQRLWLARFEGKILARAPELADFPDWATLAAGRAASPAGPGLPPRVSATPGRSGSRCCTSSTTAPIAAGKWCRSCASWATSRRQPT